MTFCSICSTQNNDDARFCSRCGAELANIVTMEQQPVVEQQAIIEQQLISNQNNINSGNQQQTSLHQMPETYLWQAIVVTIVCCMPLGIPAIVNSTQVESRFLRGDIEGSQRASRNAKNFCIWSLVGGIIYGIILFAVYIFAIIGNEALGEYIF